MECCVNFVRYILLLVLFISLTFTLIVLGVDLDWMINGPEFVTKVIARIKERLVNEEYANEEKLLEDLTLVRQSVWLQVFVIIIVAIAIVFIISVLFGCAGACTLSYSLLSGFTVFMVLMSIMAITTACAFLIPLNSTEDMKDSPLASKPMVQDLMHQYNQPPVKMLIDAVQQELQCCGYDSKDDWLVNQGFLLARSRYGMDEDMETGNITQAATVNITQAAQETSNITKAEKLIQEEDLLPRSCCSPYVGKCTKDQGFAKPCKTAIRENFLKPNNVIGIIGLATIVVVSFMCFTVLISLLMCCIARRYRDTKWSVVNWGGKEGPQDSVVLHQSYHN